MGGKLFKNIRRYAKEEFYLLADRVVPRIEGVLKTDAQITRSFSDKDSFGDMDVLVKLDHTLLTSDEIEDLILELYPNTKYIHLNGNCCSFELENLQIDLILIKPKDWETAKAYYSYNDISNLIGGIYSKFGLKYGWDGVKKVVRDEKRTKIYGEIYLTKNPKEALEFIGLNYDRFEKGFDLLEETFDYVISSKYFNKEEYAFENLSNAARKRSSLRKNYHKFLNYIRGEGEYNNREVTEDKCYYGDVENSEKLYTEYFKDCNYFEQKQLLLDKDSEILLVKSKFNGRIVMDEFPELSGKALNVALKNFRESVVNFHEYALNNSKEKIIEDFKLNYKK